LFGTCQTYHPPRMSPAIPNRNANQEIKPSQKWVERRRSWRRLTDWS
jgi:hypothetical protein